MILISLYISYTHTVKTNVYQAKELCNEEPRTTLRVTRQIVIRGDLTMKIVSELLFVFHKHNLGVAVDLRTLSET